MGLLAVAQPTLQPRAEPSHLQPLAATAPGFQAGEAHVVFLAPRDLPDALAESILTSEEAERGRRLVAPAVRRAFVAGRWLLRSVLASLAGVEPRSLELRAGAHGKLFLVGHEQLAACFNLSHSGDLVALALVRARPIGVDIEAERPFTDAALLAGRILSPRERERFESLPADARSAALLTAWTRKEAVLKAMGTGIAGGLSEIDVVAETVVCSGETPTTWFVRTLSMPPRFYGAIAQQGESIRFATWQAVPL